MRPADLASLVDAAAFLATRARCGLALRMTGCLNGLVLPASAPQVKMRLTWAPRRHSMVCFNSLLL